MNDIARSLLPMLIAAGALLAMVSLRNSDIATRFRANVKSLDDAKEPAKEFRLRRQNWWFLARYVLTSACFIILACAMTFLSLATRAGIGTPPDKVATSNEGSFFVHGGIVLLIIGLLLLCVEFAIGPITLMLDGGQSAKRLIRFILIQTGVAIRQLLMWLKSMKVKNRNKNT